MAWTNKESKVDYTGASAQEYVDRYTNRPEDAGSLEGIQNILSNIGMVPGVGEPADLLNSLLYGMQGKGKEAGLSALSMLPFIGGLVKPGRKAGKALSNLYNPGGRQKFKMTAEDASKRRASGPGSNFPSLSRYGADPSEEAEGLSMMQELLDKLWKGGL